MMTKISHNTMKDTINDLKLFSQTNYCKKFLRINYDNIDDKSLEVHAEISSACFRQAFEYYNTAINSPITTSPLLYSYCLNNMAKGMTYLLTTDEKILNGFRNHGFTVNSSKIKSDLLSTPITINATGATQSLLALTNSSIIKNVDITFDELIKRVPSLRDIYEKSTDSKSYVLRKDEDYEYSMNGEIDENDKIQKIFEKLNITYGYQEWKNETKLWIPISGQKIIEENEKNYIYLDTFVLPFEIDNEIAVINQIFVTYLIIMGYGMLVRYNAHKWEKFIDSKSSDENVLISTSISSCVESFLNIIHYLLFNYNYIEEKYTDNKVKDLLQEKETIDIIEEKLVERLKEGLR